MSKTFKKIHESKDVADKHIAKIKKRGGKVKKTVKNGKIILGWETFEDKVNIFIEDNGKGIKKEELNKIFEPFFQGTNQSSKGSGLGLTLVKAMVNAHKGEITIKSELNKGTKVILHFKKN